MNDEIQIIYKDYEISEETISSVRKMDWYKELTDDIRSELVEVEFNVHYELIRLYHGIGKKIIANVENFKRENIYGKKVIKIIGEDTNRDQSVVRRMVQFYLKAPDLEQFLSDKPKNLTWSKIRSEYLPTKPSIDVRNESNKVNTNLVQKQPELVINVETKKTLDVENKPLQLFTLDKIINLFVELIVADSKDIYSIFADNLKGTDAERNNLEDFLDKYVEDKPVSIRNHIQCLMKAIEGSNKLSQVNNQLPLFTEELLVSDQSPNTSKNVHRKTNHTTDTQRLIEKYKQVFKEKYRHDASESPNWTKKVSALVKEKINQGYSIEEIINLFEIFAQSKDSVNMGLNLTSFLHPTVFNKMIAIKNSNPDSAQEGKYAKYE